MKQRPTLAPLREEVAANMEILCKKVPFYLFIFLKKKQNLYTPARRFRQSIVGNRNRIRSSRYAYAFARMERHIRTVSQIVSITNKK